MLRGIFLSLEGIDGAGKSTQLQRLHAWLVAKKYSVVLTRDPGGPPASETLRTILLDPATRLSMRAEMLLYQTSRAQLVEEVIRPALASQQIVLCDRFLLSTIVYQGHAGGYDLEQIRATGAIATAGVMPDWVGILDLDPAAAQQRRQGPGDRIEQRSAEYHARVRQGYQHEAAADPGRLRLFDARQEPEVLHQQIVAEVRHVLDDAGWT